MKATLIINGGTTNLRVALLDSETYRLLAEAKADGGVRHTAIDGDNHRLLESLHACICKVLDHAHMERTEIDRAIAYGMITSGLGLYEIPHLPAPAGIPELRSGMREKRFEELLPIPIEFIPGVRNFSDIVTAENVSRMDMMRGEEVEAIGLYSLLQLKEEAMLVLPGSHNKFVHLDRTGKILGCMTSISGELLDAITHHTILSGSVGGDFCTPETYQTEFALQGAKECRKSGIGRAAFAGRILNTLGQQNEQCIRSFLLGAVLAEDVKAMEAFAGEGKLPKVYVAGKEPLQRAICEILAEFGYEVQPVSAQITGNMGIHGVLTISGKMV